MKKVQIKKVVSNQIETFFPQTSADMVVYDSNQSVSDVLASVISELASLRQAIEDNAINLYNDNSEEVSLLNSDTNSSAAVIDDGSSNNIEIT